MSSIRMGSSVVKRTVSGKSNSTRAMAPASPKPGPRATHSLPQPLRRGGHHVAGEILPAGRVEQVHPAGVEPQVGLLALADVAPRGDRHDELRPPRLPVGLAGQAPP